jgi:SNF2 family DNA or RNA helicase
MDFQMNRLGTCKHIERVFQVVTHRRKGKFRDATGTSSPVEEIFVDTTLEHPRLRRLPPDTSSTKLRKILDPFFDSEGLSVGPLPEALAGITEAVEGLSPRLQKQVRLSRHMTVWADQTRRRAELDRTRRNFEADVAAGKRTDNPVNLPLYPYQKEGMRHLAFLGRAMLADEMGLGKTVQAIAAAELLRGLGRIRRVLIVCPASLKGEWSDQLTQFTGKQAEPVFGPRHARLEMYRRPHEYLLCNYEQIRIDMDEINRYFSPDLIVLDEAQRIKNWPTKTAKTIKRLQSPYAFVLTGTPLENRVQELYSLAEFVDPQLFGTLARFNREFMILGEDEKSIRPRDLHALHRRVTSIMLRRRKADVEDDLPGREEKFYRVPMTPEQQLRYGDYE